MHSTSLAYDDADRLVTRQYDNGAVTTQSYDPAGNVTSITNRGPTSLVSRLSYAYNAANRRTVQSESDGTVTTWTYDTPTAC